MGICLDTDQQNGSQMFEENDARATGRWRGEAGLLATPPDGHFPKQNVGPVKFEIPKIPVIFVLGGPGSGKVTYCDNLIQEKKGITHINMMDLLQQYALGNDMQDFGQLSSKTVTEVLMLEMKMSPGSKVFLVSGYPRNMRDVVEYAEKIKIVNGVVLVSWRQEVLERQIDFGAQLGHVIIGLARMELHNFYRNVMPVAEYFDQSGMLLEINGERNPSEVYVSFRDAVLRILGMSSGEIQDQDIPQSLEAEVEVERRKESTTGSPLPQQIMGTDRLPVTVPIDTPKTAAKPRKGLPSFIWVIGGPGSNKAALCAQAVRNMPRWMHISIGELLRTMASSNMVVNDAIVSGEMVPHDIVIQLVEQQIILNRDSDGIVMDGYPRDLNQVQEFQSKFGQEPPLVLLDCSKLQLGRGRLDDSVSAFRKRLELFREVSLPMLKTLDSDSRLIIVDGDTDVPSVQQDFAAALYQLMRGARRGEEGSLRDPDSPVIKGHPNGIHASNERAIPNGNAKPTVNGVSNHVGKIANATKNGIVAQGVGTISNGVLNNMKHIQQNGHAYQNGIANGTHMLQNGVAHLANGIVPGNNKVAPAMHNYLPKDPIRKMYNEIDGYQQNLHM
ncbi:adenylate kinase isoenzyme 5 [Temnothorax curvispinosus]|uniref:Adenylate kinase isoenzyme 5 n=1 Tax=Temnothorax curvispinosus TaxID=300111 RepID=A0A6J1QUA0_9HYME|nr:adenylate kinase isoenzyme 5 [Temnothorax curvispinosus]XP_024884501.1 adenylate kinase isoenzyme 5 [Temnothorax curvispinosus]XP_024884502.1 adenylate kinase isoenzyme 5 [Temnothorax curvispinosus]